MASGSMKSTPYTKVYGVSENGYSKGRTSKVMYMNEKLWPQAMKLSKNIQLATRYAVAHCTCTNSYKCVTCFINSN